MAAQQTQHAQHIRYTGLLLVMAALCIGASEHPAPQDLANTAKARAAEVKTPRAIPAPATRDRVRALADEARQRAQQQAAQVRARIDQAIARRETMQSHASSAAPEAGRGAASRAATPVTAGTPPLAGRVVIALSSSLPEAMWRDYLAQLDAHPEAVVVLRGFIGGAGQVQPTGTFIERLRRRLPNDPKQGHRKIEVLVDPLLYAALGIDRVPAVAWLPGVQDIRHCDQETYSAATVVYGAVAVEAALKAIDQRSGTVPTSVLRAFTGAGWEHRR